MIDRRRGRAPHTIALDGAGAGLSLGLLALVVGLLRGRLLRELLLPSRDRDSLARDRDTPPRDLQQVRGTWQS